MMKSPSKNYLLNTLLSSPIESMMSFLIFILSGQLGASPLQLFILTCLKPVSSCAAFFMSGFVDHNPKRVRPYLILNALMCGMPCLLFPYIDSVNYYIFSFALMTISIRATYPVWIEYLKKEESRMERVISQSNSLHYGITLIAPMLLACSLDLNPDFWRWIFVAAACLQLSAIALFFSISFRTTSQAAVLPSFTSSLLRAWEIIKNRRAFLHYLAIFFIGGIGIIAIQPILPIYFKQELKLNYKEMAFALSVCKGVSFIFSSPLWASFTQRYSLFWINGWMNLLTSLFFLLLLAAFGSLAWVYLAYLFYGVMQAGSKMSWNLSGAYFSEEEESTTYSSLNMALVGIRGIICPTFGYLLYSLSNTQTLFYSSLGFCLVALLYSFWADHRYGWQKSEAF